jgi:hypothetical protein
VRIEFPVNDPAIDDFYAAIVHGFETVGGLPANSVYFNWTVAGPTGTLAVSPDALDVTGGQVETLNVSWSGLFSGPGAKIKGEISHSAGGSIQDLTTISVENDEGATYAELCALIPDEFGC